MGFDFEGAKTWEVSTDTYLPSGNFVVDISSATSSKSSGGFPQIELEVRNAQGSRKDWIVYKEENGVAKVATLFRIAGIQLTNGDQDEHGQLKDEKVKQLVGKRVGVVIRDEESYKEPGKFFPRIKGYVPVEAVGEAAPPSTTSSADAEIPF